MPIEVDTAERLRQIADATVKVAERDGPNAVTIRSVAAELGGSTTMVTNYVATRSDLLLNAVQRARRRWDEEAAREFEHLSGAELFRALSMWSCTTTDGDQAVRQIGVSLAGRIEDQTETRAALTENAIEQQAELVTALSDANIAEPEIGGDLMYLVLRGFYADSVVDPKHWNEERALTAVSRLCDLLLADREVDR